MDLDTEIAFQECGIEIESFSDLTFLSNGFMLEKLNVVNGQDLYSLYLGIDHTTRVYWPSTELGHNHIDGPICLVNFLDMNSYRREAFLDEIMAFLRKLN